MDTISLPEKISSRVPPVRRQEGVISQHLHAEAVDGLLCHHVADLAQAQQAQGLALQIHALDPVADLVIPVPNGLVKKDQLFGAGQDQHHGVLRYRHRIGQGAVGHPDVQVSRRVQIDLVQADAVLADDLQMGRRLHDPTCDMLVPGQQRIAVCSVFHNGLFIDPPAHFDDVPAFPQIVLFGEIVFSGLGNVRRDQDLLFHVVTSSLSVCPSIEQLSCQSRRSGIF